MSDTHAMPLHEVINDIIPSILESMVKKEYVSVPLIQGAPGAGKTSKIEQMVHTFKGVGMIHIQLSQVSAEEMTGLPDFTKKTFYPKFDKNVDENGEFSGIEAPVTEWTLPELVSQIWELSSNNKYGIVFFDDIHTLPDDMWKYLIQLFTSREIKGYKIPENIFFILAGNTGSKAMANTMPSMITNRCALLPVYADKEDWYKNFAIPAGVHPAVSSFLNLESNSKYFHGEEVVDDAWPSPRAWHSFSNILHKLEKKNKEVTDGTILYVASGVVGKEAAAKFVEHYRIFAVINVSEIFDEKEKITIPENDLAKQYIYTIASCREYYNRAVKLGNQKADKDEFERITNIMADIIIGISRVRMQFGYSAFNEIVLLSENSQASMNKLYLNLRKSLRSKDREISKRILEDIDIVNSEQ